MLESPVRYFSNFEKSFRVVERELWKAWNNLCNVFEIAIYNSSLEFNMQSSSVNNFYFLYCLVQETLLEFLTETNLVELTLVSS